MIVKKIFYFILFSSCIVANNTHPIILIHGFLGWGRNEMPGYYYWGGHSDIEKKLIESGHTVYSVSVGPISSNLDRAIETFYQIKGGQLNYGKIRSDSLKFIQKPKNKLYKGFYPSWDANNPVHIVGHSQGGQTAKQLEMLLKKKNENEDSILLSDSLIGWIKSITTISTPHNGTTLVPIMLNTFPFLLDLAPWFAGIDITKIKEIYNFDLEHWGIKREKKESLFSYYDRIANSPLSNSKNLCSWDLSVEGAAEFNDNYKIDENIYYFSFSTFATKKKEGEFYHKPDKTMSWHLKTTAKMIGEYKHSPNSDWYENDGICNTISMDGPKNQNIITYNGTPKKGVWQKMKKINMDHQTIIGHFSSKKDNNNIIVLYKEHAELLKSLK